MEAQALVHEVTAWLVSRHNSWLVGWRRSSCFLLPNSTVYQFAAYGRAPPPVTYQVPFFTVHLLTLFLNISVAFNTATQPRVILKQLG